MFKFFKKESKTSNALDYAQSKSKENLEDFILILKQIQEANNYKTSRQGAFTKDSKERHQLIDNITTLAIEKTQEKIMELV